LDDKEGTIKKFQKELNSGIASLILLGVLANSSEPLYGYQIARQIGAGQKDGLSMKQGALYPVLRSLENIELLQSHVEPSVSAPPRRYYQITPSGKAAFQEWKSVWEQTRDYVDATLKGTK
jgi:PadR family transcriptional regulator, regulatory protein PadR